MLSCAHHVRAILQTLLIASLLLPSASSEAQRRPTRREREAWEQLQAAETSYEEQEYAEALRHLRAAWALFEAPVIRFNQGKTLEALERWHDAANAYEDYLTLDPDSHSAGGLDERIADLRSRCPRGPCPEPESVERRDVPQPTETGLAPLPLSIAIAGGASSVVGAVFWGLAASDKGELSDEATPLAELTDLEDRARRRATLGNVLVPLGATLMAAGIVWLIVRANRDAPVSVSSGGVALRF